jgi:hypothetical protein
MPDVRAFNIEAFKARFGDGAKASLFYYQPNWPGALNADIEEEDAIYLVRTAQMPSTTLEEQTLNWQGFDWKYPGKHTYAPITVTFNVDLNARIRMLFEKWSNLAHNPTSNFYTTHDVFMADQVLQMIGYEGQVILEFTLRDAWPQEVAQIAMDYASTEVAQFDVTFSYQYHEVSFNEKGGLQTTLA